jgi:hypothetical protein
VTFELRPKKQRGASQGEEFSRMEISKALKWKSVCFFVTNRRIMTEETGKEGGARSLNAPL